MKDESTPKDERSEKGHSTRGPRRLAEWVSFGLSLGLVLALAAHLVWRMLREPPGDIGDATIELQLDRVTERRGRFVLPLLVKNPSPRTVVDLQIRVGYRTPEGEPESFEVTVDYVGQSSEQVIYAHFQSDPRSLAVHAEPLSYRVD